MKTIYNVKALCVVALLGSAAAASAQEDVTKEKNLNREMTLEREYDPSVQDASKVNTLPVVKEPEVRKIPIDYSNYTIAADPQKEISLLPSGNIMTQMDYNKRRGYFNFGIGTYLNINGDLGYHILSTEKDKLNIWYSHRSTNGKVKYIQMDDEKVKAKINDKPEKKAAARPCGGQPHARRPLGLRRTRRAAARSRGVLQSDRCSLQRAALRVARRLRHQRKQGQHSS